MTEDLDQGKKEMPTNSVVIYTEVTPERARAIFEGNYKPNMEILAFPMRWYAETVLDHYEPDSLKEKDITRHQFLFTTPIPFQGWSPMDGKVLIELEVDPSGMCVVEATHVSEIITPQFSVANIKNIQRLDQSLGFAKERIKKERFEEVFNSLPEDEKNELIKMSEDNANKYWESAMPYTDYIKDGLNYEEPEILMKADTQILSARRKV